MTRPSFESVAINAPPDSSASRKNSRNTKGYPGNDRSRMLLPDEGIRGDRIEVMEKSSGRSGLMLEQIAPQRWAADRTPFLLISAVFSPVCLEPGEHVVDESSARTRGEPCRTPAWERSSPFTAPARTRWASSRPAPGPSPARRSRGAARPAPRRRCSSAASGSGGPGRSRSACSFGVEVLVDPAASISYDAPMLVRVGRLVKIDRVADGRDLDRFRAGLAVAGPDRREDAVLRLAAIARPSP